MTLIRGRKSRTLFAAIFLIAAILSLYVVDLTGWLCQERPPECEGHLATATQFSFRELHLAARTMIAEGHIVPYGLPIALPALAVLVLARSLILRMVILVLFFLLPATTVANYSQYYSCNHGTCDLDILFITQNFLHKVGAIVSLAYLGYWAYRKGIWKQDPP